MAGNGETPETGEASTSGFDHVGWRRIQSATGTLTMDNGPSNRFQTALESENENSVIFANPQPVATHLPSDAPIELPPEHPYDLPNQFEWSTCDITDTTTVTEICTLLNSNNQNLKVSTHRSVEFIRWALKAPGYPDWHVGVRVKTSKTLVGFVAGSPERIRIRARDTAVMMAELKFHCVHKEFRSKGLESALIKEVKRRVHLKKIWKIWKVLEVSRSIDPKGPSDQIAKCQHWFRLLNPKKLIDSGLTSLPPIVTMTQVIHLFELPNETLTPGFRPMQRVDIAAVTRLLKEHLSQFAIAPYLLEKDLEKLLLPIENVMHSFVVENPESYEITDFCSFYTVPFSIMTNHSLSVVKFAYSYYNAAPFTPIRELMNDAVIMAKRQDCDLFNMFTNVEMDMDIFNLLRGLKFKPALKYVHFCLDNLRLQTPAEVSFILMNLMSTGYLN